MTLAQITNIPPVSTKFSNYNPDVIGLIVSRILTFSIAGAGIYFFVRLLSAGYGFLTSAGEPGKVQMATKELTNAAIGLIIVITAYFIAQILQVIFGIKILS